MGKGDLRLVDIIDDCRSGGFKGSGEGTGSPAPEDNRIYLKKEYWMPFLEFVTLPRGKVSKPYNPYRYYAEIKGKRYYAKVRIPDKKPEHIKRSDFYRVVEIDDKEFPVKTEGMFKYIEPDSRILSPGK